MALKKELTLITLVLYGVGIILGAGIYALIGTGASLAGNMLWLAFALATILAVFTGLSYAELSSMFPKEAAEYVYTKKAFGIESLSFILSWTMVIIGIISAAVVALAFGGYLSYMLGGDANLYAAGLIILLSALNYIGIKESVLFNNFASVIEALGLVAVIIIGFFLSGNTISELNLTELPPAGFHGIFSAIGVIFFAFIGFEYIANISEEVKDSKTVVPQAVIISLVISSVLYILLSIAILLLVPWEELASSPAPLTSAVGKSIPNASIIISIIALFATSNTVLIILIGSSRILYGMSSNKSLPSLFSMVSSRGTPYFAIALAGAGAVFASLYGDIKSIAQLTDLGIFIVYLFVNLALIKLRFTKYKRKFISPSLFGFPVFAIFGVLSSGFMLLFFEFHIWLMQAVVLAIGFAVLYLYKKK